MDLHLPDASGIEATRRILAAAPDTRVLALTMDRSESTVLAALRAGARGYLLKDAAAESIGGAIATLLRGELVLDTHFAGRLATLLTPPVSPDPGLEQLTRRELDILALIADGHSNAEIGRRLFLAEKTVRNTITSILAKTGSTSRADLIERCAALYDSATGQTPPGRTRPVS